MGWNGLAIGIPFRSGGLGWIDFWRLQPEVLFFGLYSEISGGQMPNKVTGSTDFLTVAGVAGSETYQAPDTAPYQTADTDYIWFKTDTTQRTVTTAELIGYDFPRTPVKYNDDSPYAIVAIMILKSGETITGTKLDKLFQDMWLHTLWDNNLNGYGHIKGNKLAQTLWTPESVLDAATIALIARMTALSETPDGTRQGVLDTAIVADKAASLWTAKYDAFWLTAAHGNDSALLNILADQYNLQLVSTPSFTIDRGFTGNGSSHGLNSGFNIQTNSVNYTQNNASVGVYIRTTAQSVGWACGAASMYLDPRYTDNNFYYAINDAGDFIANLDASGMWILSRTGANTIVLYKNGVSFDTSTKTSIAIASKVFHLLCMDGSSQFSTYEIALAFIGGGMSQAQVTGFQTIWIDGYLTSIGAKV